MDIPKSLVGEKVQGRYRFGEFVFDLERGFLQRNGDEVSLRPKAFQALRYLVLHPGTLISKDELAQAVWEDVAVTDNSLAQCMLELRRALSDDDKRLIRTVARRGYVFVAPVTVEDFQQAHLPAAAPTSDPEAPQTQPATVPRIANYGSWLVLTVLAVFAGAVGLWRSAPSSPTAPLDEAPVQLTNFNDSVVSPSLSRDGRMLSFVRGGIFGAVGASRGQLYVKALDNGSPVQLTHDSMGKINPVFSPDDSRIVYTTLLPGLSWDSWQVPVLGGAPQPFLPNASGLQWLDDGRLIYSTIKAGIHMGIATSTESRDDYREIYFPSQQDGMAHRSAASPDGKWLLVVEMLAGTWIPCRLVPMDGSSAGASVGPPGAQCTSAAWSPDGQWMYFSSDAGGGFHIWRQKFPRGAPEQITFGPTEQEGTAILPDGRHLITSMGLQQVSIWLHEAHGERKLTDEGFALHPAVSTSGDRLFYLVRSQMSWGQSSGELWQLDIRSGERKRLLPGMVLENYSVSADDRTVVYSPAGQDGKEGIWITDLEGRKPPRQLVRGARLRAFFGAPGEIVYAGQDGHLYRMHEDGTGRERISQNPIAYLVTVSPDGRWAEAVLPRSSNGAGTTSLWFVSLRGEPSFEVCDESCSVGPRSFLIGAPFEWSRDGKRLFVNLRHFGKKAPRVVVLPYRSDAPTKTLWPAGLTSEKSVTGNPGARVIEGAMTLPASGPDDYLSVRIATQSNLYRIRIPE